MKRARVLLVCSLLCSLGLTSVVMANPTSETNTDHVVVVEDDSEDSDLFLEGWWNSVLDDLFGIDRGRKKRYYYVYHSSGDDDSGDDALGYDPGDDGLGYDFGDGDPGLDPGDGGLGGDPDNGCPADGPASDGLRCDGEDSSPAQTIPTPGALLLGAIGLSSVGWLRRRRAL